MRDPSETSRARPAKPGRLAGMLILALAVLAGGRGATREFPDQIPEVRLDEVLWQTLPDPVREVYVGPDDRVWCQLEHPSKAEDLAQVRRVIEREFRRKTPQLFGARVALFEDGGRTWFITRSGRVLLGYDGERWIERRAEGQRFFMGTCPGHGLHWGYDVYNQAFQGRSFIVESHGVHCFDGRDWSYQQMRPDDDKELRYPDLLPEAGGGLLAVLKGKAPIVWLWREGRWRRIDAGVTLGDRTVQGFAPISPDGCWLFAGLGALYVPYAAREPKDLDKLLAGLGAEDFRVREDSTAALVALGEAVMPFLEKARAASQDPEVQNRLKLISEQLAAGAAKGVVHLGGNELRGLQLQARASDGTVFLTAEAIKEGPRDRGPGLIVAGIDGRIRVLAGKDIRAAWEGVHTTSVLTAKPGSRYWIPGSAAGPVRLLDLEAGKYTDSFPGWSFFWPQAVRKDGTVLASPNVPGQLQCWPVGAYRPGARDTRLLLRGRETAVRSEAFCAAADGSIWADTAELGPARFDGREWQKVEAPRDGRCRFLPGRKGYVLAGNGGAWTLTTPVGVHKDTDLRRMIGAHPDDFRAAFPAGPDTEAAGNAPGLQIVSVAADRAGNIWVLEGSQLQVLVDGQWVKAEGTPAGGQRRFSPSCLLPVGDGSRMYLSDFMMFHSGGRSRLGRVLDGRLSLGEAPHCTQRELMASAVRDRQGGLWVNAPRGNSAGTCDFYNGQIAHRLTEGGVVEKHENCGYARLCDRGGNVWLGSLWGGPPGRFNVWREGRLAGSVSVPGADEGAHLFSDRPGSIYVLGRAGLEHLTAEDPASPAAFSRKALYWLDGVEGRGQTAALSPTGQLAVLTATRSGNRDGYRLQLFQLPGTTERPKP